MKLLPQEKEASVPAIEITRIPEQRLGNVTISLHEISELLNRMYNLVQSSLDEAFRGLTTLEWDKEKILEQEARSTPCIVRSSTRFLMSRRPG